MDRPDPAAGADRGAAAVIVAVLVVLVLLVIGARRAGTSMLLVLPILLTLAAAAVVVMVAERDARSRRGRSTAVEPDNEVTRTMRSALGLQRPEGPTGAAATWSARRRHRRGGRSNRST